MPVPASQPEPDHRVSGSIKRLLAEKGYGYVVGDDGVDYFFHRTDLRRGENLHFPSNTCTCWHDSYSHVPDKTAKGGYGACVETGCQCQGYVRRPSPGAVYVGQLVTFAPGSDDRGPRAHDIARTP